MENELGEAIKSVFSNVEHRIVTVAASSVVTSNSTGIKGAKQLPLAILSKLYLTSKPKQNGDKETRKSKPRGCLATGFKPNPAKRDLSAR
ncbi:hypothetical protein KFK09_013171 [Dendrobium nobile]|uniref:Uncharacterized protein n=1 Tax=Dendrobium nobile TaxID=94219 RepID=A0A8T3B6M5_DENNO|nr:hypothetical protein KFK09_013171 [Dendrobium nobile]